MVVQWLRLPAPNAEGRVRPLVRDCNEELIKKKKKRLQARILPTGLRGHQSQMQKDHYLRRKRESVVSCLKRSLTPNSLKALVVAVP